MSVRDAQPRSGETSAADEMGGCLSATGWTVAGWRLTPGGRKRRDGRLLRRVMYSSAVAVGRSTPRTQ